MSDYEINANMSWEELKKTLDSMLSARKELDGKIKELLTLCDTQQKEAAALRNTVKEATGVSTKKEQKEEKQEPAPQPVTTTETTTKNNEEITVNLSSILHLLGRYIIPILIVIGFIIYIMRGNSTPQPESDSLNVINVMTDYVTTLLG